MYCGLKIADIIPLSHIKKSAAGIRKKVLVLSAMLAAVMIPIPAAAAFSYAPVSASIPVTVENAAATATIVAEYKEDVPAPEKNSLTPDGNGWCSFNISFNEPGEYTYTITQTQTDKTVTADKSKYEALICVSDTKESGELSCSVSVNAAGSDNKLDEIRFLNKLPGNEENPKTSGGSGSQTVSGKSGNYVKTGDENNIAILAGLLFVSVAGIVLVVRKKSTKI